MQTKSFKEHFSLSCCINEFECWNLKDTIQHDAIDSGSSSAASKTGFCCIFHDFFFSTVALLEGSASSHTSSDTAFVVRDWNSFRWDGRYFHHIYCWTVKSVIKPLNMWKEMEGQNQTLTIYVLLTAPVSTNYSGGGDARPFLWTCDGSGEGVCSNVLSVFKYKTDSIL